MTPYCLQFPYIKHGSNTFGDTAFIIKYLQATYGNPPPNSALLPLDPQQQALSTLCSVFATERLAYIMLPYRFLTESVQPPSSCFSHHLHAFVWHSSSRTCSPLAVTCLTWPALPGPKLPPWNPKNAPCIMHG